MEYYRNWKEAKTSGGPEKQWSAFEQEQIFKGVLKGMFTPEELDTMWKQIQSKQKSTVQKSPVENRSWPKAA